MTYATSRAFEATDAPLSIRPPSATDGARIWALIETTPSLDSNSLYCNLLQCTHFADTCALAERDGEILGWVSGHIPPGQPDTLFVWQVCVSDAARGLGIARRLIGDVLSRPACAGVAQIACTITADNAASWGLFSSIARRIDADLGRREHFSRESHFGGMHDSEFAVSIGPFERAHAAPVLAI
jgi:L-2,4-diaminobutyric acid acetyltransferase